MTTYSNQVSIKTRVQVGLFTLFGFFLIGAVSVYVNHKPQWWRACQLVHINVEDGTGLKSKSPVKSLGIEIGYLKTVELTETYVSLGICITAPVEVLPTTRAYIRSEGFLGDKFVELKPMRYVGPHTEAAKDVSWFFPNAYAEEPSSNVANAATTSNEVPVAKPAYKTRDREIPVGQGSQDVQQLVGRVDQLVGEVTSLTNNLKQAINPEELRQTMRQLNKTLENASRTLSPDGGLNQTAQRTLGKLEDTIEQLRDQMTRVNQGKGSLGMLLNDPSYAEEIKEVIHNANKLLSKVGGVRFNVNIGGEEINGYDSGRGWFQLSIWPEANRYYKVGIAVDPRGSRTETDVTTTSGGVTTLTQTEAIEPTHILITAMFGKVFYNNRLDLSLGVLYGDATASVGLQLGPVGMEDRIKLTNDIYSRSGPGEHSPNDRITLTLQPYMGIYVNGGIDSLYRVNNSLTFFYGAGITFDDEDIKLLFALR